MALYKKKPDPLGTTRITGKELEVKYASDPEGRFEINTAWGFKLILKGSMYHWYVALGLGKENLFTQEEVEELPEILYTHSAFLTKE